ncbi:MAG: hypothetical protein JWM35_1655, partial [Verrucomicrobia bacterium]|nr:hypothetical protein [Verrucomicrobiota bacterium]
VNRFRPARRAALIAAMSRLREHAIAV